MEIGDVRSNWTSRNLSELLARITTPLQECGWVTASDAPNNQLGLLNRIVDALILGVCETGDKRVTEATDIHTFARYVVGFALKTSSPDNASAWTDAVFPPWPSASACSPAVSDQAVAATIADLVPDTDWLNVRASLAALCLQRLSRELDCRSGKADSPLGPSSNDDVSRRISWLWAVLLPTDDSTPPESGYKLPYWVPPPCLPKRTSGHDLTPLPVDTSDKTTLDLPEAMRLVSHRERQFVRSYGVWFPVVFKVDGNSQTKEGCVLRAEVHLYRADEHSAFLPGGSAGSIEFSPWSTITVEPGTRETLAESIQDVIRLESGDFPWVAHVEIVSVSGSKVLSWRVEGMSLSVAVSVALWAARDGLSLYDIVVSGRLHGRGMIGPIDDAETKLRVSVSALSHVPDLRVFLRCDNFEFGGLKWESSNCYEYKQGGHSARVYRLPNSLDELKSRRDELLTDGFDDYRQKLSSLAPEALKLTELCAKSSVQASWDAYLEDDRIAMEMKLDAIESGTRFTVIAIPFDVDPQPAVEFAAHRLQNRFKQNAGPRVVLPLSLTSLGRACPERKLAERTWPDGPGRDDVWTAAVLDAANEMHGSLGEALRSRHESLRDLLSRLGWSRICFVAFAKKSSQLRCAQQLARHRGSGDQPRLVDQRTASSHESYAGSGGAPMIVLIASDDHFAEFGRAIWQDRDSDDKSKLMRIAQLAMPGDDGI